MKIKLLNDGGYGDMDEVKFPVEVEAACGLSSPGYVVISKEELYRVGAKARAFDVISSYTFLVGEHVEVIK